MLSGVAGKALACLKTVPKVIYHKLKKIFMALLQLRTFCLFVSTNVGC